jgi:hypothetical protein
MYAMDERVTFETNVPFDVRGVKDSGDVAVLLTFYNRKVGPDLHFGLTPHAATHLIEYVRETLGEAEVFGPNAEPILPAHPARADIEQLLRESDEWAVADDAKLQQLDAKSRSLILTVFDRLTSPEKTRLLEEMRERTSQRERP